MQKQLEQAKKHHIGVLGDVEVALQESSSDDTEHFLDLVDRVKKSSDTLLKVATGIEKLYGDKIEDLANYKGLHEFMARYVFWLGHVVE